MGRDRELTELLAALDEASAGRGWLVLLAGEPGIGKSRLADEVADRARDRRIAVLWGRSWEAGGAPAFWPWVQAMRSLVRRRDRDVLWEDVGSAAPELAQILPELRSLFPDLPTPEAVDPETARFRLFDAVATFLKNASAREPLLIVLDNLHSAATPSFLLLRFVASELTATRILILGAYREVVLMPDHPVAGGDGDDELQGDDENPFNFPAQVGAETSTGGDDLLNCEEGDDFANGGPGTYTASACEAIENVEIIV